MIGNAITGELKYLIPDPGDLSKMTDTGTSAKTETKSDTAGTKSKKHKKAKKAKKDTSAAKTDSTANPK